MSKLLLINDLAGYGKVALSAMIPILSHMQYEVCSLPTALVSNTLDYGKFEILETTSYMKNTLQVWDELGFQFDAVSTGFIVSRPQTELVRDFCRAQKAKGTRIFTDPIMGDEGKLYNGVGEETVALMRELIATADYIVPNYTEAGLPGGRALPVRRHHAGGTVRSGRQATHIGRGVCAHYQRTDAGGRRLGTDCLRRRLRRGSRPALYSALRGTSRAIPRHR